MWRLSGFRSNSGLRVCQEGASLDAWHRLLDYHIRIERGAVVYLASIYNKGTQGTVVETTNASILVEQNRSS